MMRIIYGTVLVALLGCGGGDGDDKAASGGSSGKPDAHANSGHGGLGGESALAGAGGETADAGAGGRIVLPKIYPLLRASTPTNLIADANYQTEPQPSSALLGPFDDAGVSEPVGGGAIGLAVAIRERLYTAGPTEILRIAQELDNRTSQLDTTVSNHACLMSAPIVRTIMLPGRQTFVVKLQCFEQRGGGWLAFGFDRAQANDDDAGVSGVRRGDDFYLVHGQEGGMGGAYHIRGATGDVEAWLTVADSRVPNNSQVVIHLLTNAAAGTTELAFAGSGVGFCSAHLKIGRRFLFIRARTNGALPPGVPMSAHAQYCDALRVGCFAIDALATDLGADAVGCRAIAARWFDIGMDLDASNVAGANVTPATIYEHFNAAPTGIPAF